MAKCPKCMNRKGKRPCPALGEAICSACCGEHRLKDIDCPEDCEYLGREEYHQQRRLEKSRSGGRDFLRFLARSFPQQPEWRFAFRFFVEVYAYSQRQGAIDDDELVEVVRGLRRLLGRVVVPGPAPHPLSVHLQELCERNSDASSGDQLSADARVRTVEKLADVITAKRGERAHRFTQLLAGFFGPLNLRADLGYDPERGALGADASVLGPRYRERPSGLIVPPASL